MHLTSPVPHPSETWRQSFEDLATSVPDPGRSCGWIWAPLKCKNSPRSWYHTRDVEAAGTSRSHQMVPWPHRSCHPCLQQDLGSPNSPHLRGFVSGCCLGFFVFCFWCFFSQKSTLGTTSCKSVTLLFGAAFYLSRNNVIRKERMKNKLLISINNFLTLSPYTFLPLFPEYMRIHSVWR